MPDIHPDDIGRSDVATLALIRTILAERSVTGGAQVAGISQPAASNALARMRRIFGDQLMVRSRGGMTLTGRGRDLLDELDEIVPRIEALGRIGGFDPVTAEMTMALAASDHASLLLVPAIVRRLRARAPRLRLSVSLFQPGSGEMSTLERTGVDLRLGWPQSLPQDWYVRRLFDDEIGVICPRDAPVEAGTITADWILAADHIALATDRPHHQSLADRALARQGLSRRIAVWTTNFSAIPLMVEQSGMVAFFPVSLARKFERFARIKVLPSPIHFGEYHVSMAWHPRIHRQPAWQWLRDEIVAASDGLAGSGETPAGSRRQLSR